MRRTKTGKWMFTKQEREERWSRCIEYIENTPTLAAARRAARRDGFCCSTSVWIVAFSKLVSTKGTSCPLYSAWREVKRG